MYRFFQDNIGYVLLEPRTRGLIAIDVGEYEASRKVIEELEKQNRTRLTHILSTHHHGDHIGGNLKWREARPEVEIVSGNTHAERIPGMTKAMNDLETIAIGDICICCMETPGHTAEHVSFIVTHVTPESTKTPLLFTGDTLFVGGCGRLLDQESGERGSAETLFYSL